MRPGSALAAQLAGWLVALALAAAWTPWRRLPHAAVRRVAPALLGLAAAANLVLGGQLDGHLLYQGDFRTYFTGAVVGLHDGWSRIYDLDLQARAWSGIGHPADFLPYLNTPPQAWVTAPLLWLPYVAAYAVWVAAMVLVAGLTLWILAGRPSRLAAAGLTALGAWVLVYTLASGQNALLGALAVALCWRMLRDGREVEAGASLWLVALRPNATLMLPLALLLAGRRRAFAVAALGLGALAVASAASLGAGGLRQFAATGAEVARTHPRAVESTLGHMLGAPGLAAGLLLAAASLLAARRGRGSAATVLAAGVLGSLFVTPYIHQQDYVVPLAAAGALLAERLEVGEARPPRWLAALLIALFALGPPGWIYGDGWVWLALALELGWLAALLANPRVEGRAEVAPRPALAADGGAGPS